MLQSGSCNGCGECPDAEPRQVFPYFGLRQLDVTFQGPQLEGCQNEDTRIVTLPAYYSINPFDPNAPDPFGLSALVPNALEPAIWATMIQSAQAFYSDIEQPYWLDDDNVLHCKAKYIYALNQTVIAGDGHKLLAFVAWLMPDPDNDQKCIWQVIALCGVCYEAKLYDDNGFEVGSLTNPSQPPFVCGLSNTTEFWQNVEVSLYRTESVAWTKRIKVERNCPVGVPVLTLLFATPNPCECTPPPPEPDCCEPNLYLTWKKTGGPECCGTDGTWANVPLECQDFVEPVPDTATADQFSPWGVLYPQRVVIPGQPDTRQWIWLYAIAQPDEGPVSVNTCIGGCAKYYCKYALFIMVQCCTAGWFYKWEWLDLGRKLDPFDPGAPRVWYDHFLPKWGPLGCIGDQIAMDGPDCFCDFPNLPITTIGPFPGCDCQIKFEVRQHPLSTCNAVEIDCCTNPIPNTLTAEITASDFAGTPVGTTFDMIWDPTYEQWVGIVPGGDTFKVYLKCCGTSHGDFFGGYTNASGDSDGMNVAETMVECVGSSLTYDVTCDPFEAETSVSWFVLNFDGTNDGTIAFRITEP